ncbi:MAG: carbamoyltransferase HypF, partial [Actinobacteria bacterium]|nr:carbamoyltransferase HypF [Actinomycetota bacterium]
MIDNKKRGNFDTYIIEVTGIVQGVGFRPFIYRLASRFCISGTVSNNTEGVIITANFSCMEELKKFMECIKAEKPPSSEIERIVSRKTSPSHFDGFYIEKSTDTGENFQLVSPDISTCDKCLEDIFNPENKNRYLYPFTNCTNCGPRFTIIKKLPYDRPNTTMEKFSMCAGCLNEYGDPLNRRFHAQPNACSRCGPLLVLEDRQGRKIITENPMETAANLIKKGNIIAIKSLGGFQIACDATSDKSVKKLRARKNRPVKPFAIMSGSIQWIRKHYFLSKKELEILKSPAAPILLLKKKKGHYPLSYFISLYNSHDGIMIPYTPIHHILFHYLDIPLVMTSGNMSEEPIASGNQEAYGRLGGICDYFLTHDRDIFSRYDDSVIKVLNNKPFVLRRARGYSPYPVKLKIDIEDSALLAVGAHEKNTFCIITRNYALVSQHIGDLDDYQSIKFFKDTLETYKKLFNIKKFDMVAYDLHPGYSSSAFALNMPAGIRRFPVQHHRAHLAGVLAENGIMDKSIGFSWDGTGYGDDGKIWGSEVFLIDSATEFKRIGHLREKLIPGGSVTVKKPYRMALAYLYDIWKESASKNGNFPDFVYKNFPFYKKIVTQTEIDAVKNQLETGFNSPITTSAGRFFDAVSSLLDLT